MKILAVDTSTAMSSIALVESGSVISMASHTDARGHVEAIGTLFTQLELDLNSLPELIACGVGPGPYTGLRVGIAFAQGLSVAWSVPTVGVCSLDGVANRVIREGLVATGSDFIAATDARRKEYYWAQFDGRGNRLSGPRVDRIDLVSAMVIERGVPFISEVFPHALDIAACAERGDARDLAPMYLREADAQPITPVQL